MNPFRDHLLNVFATAAIIAVGGLVVAICVWINSFSEEDQRNFATVMGGLALALIIYAVVWAARHGKDEEKKKEED